MKFTLFDIEKNLKEVMDGIGSEGEDKEATIIQLSNMLISKTDHVSHYRESLVNYIGLVQAKVTELKTRQAQIENKLEAFDQYVLNCMNIQCRDEYLGEFCKIKKRKPSQTVDIFNEDLIPVEFIKIPEVRPMIMKAEISKALKNGEVIDGARLIDGKISLMYSTK